MSECAGVQTAQGLLSCKNGNRSARPLDRFDPEQRSEALHLVDLMTRQWFGQVERFQPANCLPEELLLSLAVLINSLIIIDCYRRQLTCEICAAICQRELQEYQSRLTIIHTQGCINLYVELKVETAGFPG
jgi:hypothetical protein